MTTKITGIVRDLEGQPLVNSHIRFERRSGVRAQDGATVVPRIVNAKTDSGGNIAVDLYPGEYSAQAERGSGALSFKVGVPEDVAQVQLQDLIDQIPSITPTWASETRQARDQAVEAAESVAGGVEAAEASANSASDSAEAASGSANSAADSASTAVGAKDDAEASETRAGEWAENPEDDPVVQFNGNEFFSAKHHAAKAAQSAALSNRVIYVDTIADLQALNTDSLPDGQQVSVTDGGRFGFFVWNAGDQSASVSSDPQKGVWVPPDSDNTGASGAFKRTFSGSLSINWFGASPGVVEDQSEAIKAALLFGSQNKTPIHIPEGVYYVADLLELRDNNCVYGDGSVSELFVMDGTNNNVFRASSRSNITLKDFSINGNKDNQTAGNGLTLSTVDRFSVSGLYIRDTFNNAMNFAGCSNGEVYFNKVEGAGNHCISTTKDSADKFSERITILGNKTANSVRRGVSVAYSKGIKVLGNSAINTEAICQIGSESSNCTVVGNEGDGNRRGIIVGAIAPCFTTVSGNVSNNTEREGIRIQGAEVAVTGNVIKNCCQSPTTGQDVERAGISILNSPLGGAVTQCVFAGNSIRSSSSNFDWGIYEESGNGQHVISSNMIKGNNEGGISLSSQNNRVSGNRYDEIFGSLASASVLVVPYDGSAYNVTGTNDITEIEGGRNQSILSLRFGGSLTVVQGNNLSIQGDFVAENGSVLTLMRIGANWFEVSRA